MSLFFYDFDGPVHNHLHNAILQLLELSDQRWMRLHLRDEFPSVEILVVVLPDAAGVMVEGVASFIQNLSDLPVELVPTPKLVGFVGPTIILLW